MRSSGLLWLLRGLEAAVVLGGVKHSDSLQQPHLRFVTLTLLLLHRLPVGPENAETLLNRRIRANPQFSVIRRKRHVARTERGNRKSTKKRTRIKTPAIHPPVRWHAREFRPTAVPNFTFVTTVFLGRSVLFA